MFLLLASLQMWGKRRRWGWCLRQQRETLFVILVREPWANFIQIFPWLPYWAEVTTLYRQMSWQPAAPLLPLLLLLSLQTATKVAGAVQTLTELLWGAHSEKTEMSGSREGTDKACPNCLKGPCFLPVRRRTGKGN